MHTCTIERYFGTLQCGHCWETATYSIKSEGWTDYECEAHTQEWWAEELAQQDRAWEARAAFLEAKAADEDFREAFKAFALSGWLVRSDEDYAVWSTASYADTALKAFVRIPIG